MIFSDFSQGTEKWFEIRRGKVTSSRLSDVLSKGRGNAPSKTRRTYMMELLVERLTGKSPETFVSRAMEQGTEQEKFARAAYEAETGHDVAEVAFAEHDDITDFGGSPDGLIGLDGGVEIKCPLPHTHYGYWESREVPRNYLLQIHGNMMVTNRTWWHFVSYNKDFPPEMRLVVVPVERDLDLWKEIEGAVEHFLGELRLEELKCRNWIRENES